MWRGAKFWITLYIPIYLYSTVLNQNTLSYVSYISLLGVMQKVCHSKNRFLSWGFWGRCCKPPPGGSAAEPPESYRLSDFLHVRNNVYKFTCRWTTGTRSGLVSQRNVRNNVYEFTKRSGLVSQRNVRNNVNKFTCRWTTGTSGLASQRNVGYSCGSCGGSCIKCIKCIQLKIKLPTLFDETQKCP